MFLAGCTATPKVQYCAPVPEQLYKTKGKPVFNKENKPREEITNQEIIDHILEFDKYNSELEYKMRLAAAHQKPCRKK